MSPNATVRRAEAAAALPCMLLLALASTSCSSAAGHASPAPHGTPSPRPAQVAAVLDRYTADPCALLDTTDLAAFDITQDARELDMFEGKSPACYWQVPHDRLMGWVTNPPETTRDEYARKPSARRIKVAGYAAVRYTPKDSCTVDVVLDRTRSFRTLTVQVKPDASADPCVVSTSFAELIITKFRALAPAATQR